MFDIGFWELTVIAVIGLIVLGPERLPVVARTLGTWVGRAKGYVRGLTSELEREVNVDDLRNSVRRTREQIESETRRTVEPIRDPLQASKTRDSASDAAKPEKTPPEASSASSTDGQTDAPQSANPVAEAGGDTNKAAPPARPTDDSQT